MNRTVTNTTVVEAAEAVVAVVCAEDCAGDGSVPSGVFG
jgi:hypothetical protein